MYKTILIITIFICTTLGKDYYELLGIRKDADQKEIRRAFKRIAVTQHPDKNKKDPNSHEKFIRLTSVYEVLKDPELRKKYDLYGEEGLDDSNKRTNYHSWTYYKNNFGIYDDDPQVITLDRNDYFESVIDSDTMWLVNFYSPMCSHCHYLAPVWRKIAKEFEGVVKIAAVNCEDDFQLCHQVGIRAYPTLLHFTKNSKYGSQYTEERTYAAITNFILQKLDIYIPEISKSTWSLLLQGKTKIEKPMLVFTSDVNHNCYTSDGRGKIAAIFDKLINVRIIFCKGENCNNVLFNNSCAVYLPTKEKSLWSPVIFNNIDIHDLVENILQQLPEPQDITEDEFKNIKKDLNERSDMGWLMCFYVGHTTELDLLLKKFPSILTGINLGKINCGKYPHLCSMLNVNRYPMWGVLKPGGAFELSHGKNTMNDIIKFVQNSVKAENVWALSAEKILSILRRKSGNEVWFLDWYAPWCPPCIEFLPEVRKASLQFNTSMIHFGTIDCTVHSTICQQYNIRSYPTAMLINGSNTYLFTLQKTAADIVQFINEIQYPTVVQITSKNFDEELNQRKEIIWVVDYFVPWCAPCQQLLPEWTIVAKNLKVLSFIKVARINCESEPNLCRSQRIERYPTIKMYPKERKSLNTATTYFGPHNSISILKWIFGYFPIKVRDMSPAALQNELLSSKKIWIIDFYAPWCSHCQKMEPQFEIAAQLFDEKVLFGRLNCDFYATECSQAGIMAYPTLMIYKPTYNLKDISKGFRIRAQSSSKIKEQILEFINADIEYNHDEL